MARTDNDAKVRELSRLLWERAGRPSGFEHEYWAMAARSVEGRNDNASALSRSVAR